MLPADDGERSARGLEDGVFQKRKFCGHKLYIWAQSRRWIPHTTHQTGVSPLVDHMDVQDGERDRVIVAGGTSVSCVGKGDGDDIMMSM